MQLLLRKNVKKTLHQVLKDSRWEQDLEGRVHRNMSSLKMECVKFFNFFQFIVRIAFDHFLLMSVLFLHFILFIYLFFYSLFLVEE